RVQHALGSQEHHADRALSTFPGSIGRMLPRSQRTAPFTITASIPDARRLGSANVAADPIAAGSETTISAARAARSRARPRRPRIEAGYEVILRIASGRDRAPLSRAKRPRTSGKVP